MSKEEYDEDILKDVAGAGIYEWVKENPKRALRQLKKWKMQGINFDESDPGYKRYRAVEAALMRLNINVPNGL